MRWININNMEPPIDGSPVLVHFYHPKLSDEGPYFIMEYHGNNNWTMVNGKSPNPSDYTDCCPIYWMYLPPPPCSRCLKYGMDGC